MRSGFTLLEVLVVLILIGMAAGLVAPAVLPPDRAEESSLTALIGSARDAAVRRGEVVYLHIASTGQWHLRGAASLRRGALAEGRLTGFQGPAATLVLSPIGTCAFDVRSARVADAIPVDPLTCELRSP
ncbi:MAG: prepilin-type N-terminal cleavage/methylation domain-containing protein [Gemmatimonadales bacterium]|nr:prepilin-type N-terminal cleavage/methylation domain-containing protein [Gemmatimonadales bacterium]NIN48503.1 prepilin-type N-terminal cleavage/methylation domain-containing protein [Gemmatimonadales bacterium]NIP05967.1 prepilin-type N-terminal cleavage/methylation domain-containing protein [Gemmatimonadales bacterium]NIQ99919.1 prepilin-type N-terminal cleavage/methylation domain-containing protein [Gemmatimonadales bacterium]NIS64378.1 prepilin-type N-terminal cleavage/methylation domain